MNTITEFIEALKWNWLTSHWREYSSEKEPKFKVGDHVTISKYKNFFAKGYSQNCSKDVFVIS